jgi:hypothetical protein
MKVDLTDEEVTSIKLAINNPTFAFAVDDEIRKSIWKKLGGK